MKKMFVMLSLVLFTGALTSTAIAAVNGNHVEIKKNDDKKKKKKGKKGACCTAGKTEEKKCCAGGEKKSCHSEQK